MNDDKKESAVRISLIDVMYGLEPIILINIILIIVCLLAVLTWFKKKHEVKENVNS